MHDFKQCAVGAITKNAATKKSRSPEDTYGPER